MRKVYTGPLLSLFLGAVESSGSLDHSPIFPDFLELYTHIPCLMTLVWVWPLAANRRRQGKDQSTPPLPQAPSPLGLFLYIWANFTDSTFPFSAHWDSSPITNPWVPSNYHCCLPVFLVLWAVMCHQGPLQATCPGLGGQVMVSAIHSSQNTINPAQAGAYSFLGRNVHVSYRDWIVRVIECVTMVSKWVLHAHEITKSLNRVLFGGQWW